jgi:hypothetical protein
LVLLLGGAEVCRGGGGRGCNCGCRGCNGLMSSELF